MVVVIVIVIVVVVIDVVVIVIVFLLCCFLVIVATVLPRHQIFILMKPVAGGSVGWGRVGKTITEPPIEMSAQALMMVTMMLLSLCFI